MATIRDHLIAHANMISSVLASDLPPKIDRMTDEIWKSLRLGHKLLVMGNGGSASQASHLASELVGRFGSRERQALPALAMTTDPSVLTALGNDLGFAHVFERQIEALAQEGDVVLAISTSGNSRNVIWGLQAAQRVKATTMALLGGGAERPRIWRIRQLSFPCRRSAGFR
jgi:D-sedoheptulose 7-phosphate isomerase